MSEQEIIKKQLIHILQNCVAYYKAQINFKAKCGYYVTDDTNSPEETEKVVKFINENLLTSYQLNMEDTELLVAEITDIEARVLNLKNETDFN